MSSTDISTEKIKPPSTSQSSTSDIKQVDIASSKVTKSSSHDSPLENEHSSNTSPQGVSKEPKPKVEPSSGGMRPPHDEFPDGGLRAWLVVFGGVCNCYATFGNVNSWGIFQAYYQETLLKDFSPSAIAWIGSIQFALIFLPGLVVGRLFDLGYFRSVFIPSSILLVVATFLTAECTKYWQFFLCQGLAIGLANGGIFGPCNAIVAHWFKKKRGRAIGLMTIGTSLGGTSIPIAAKNLIPRVGFPWTMRIIGFILLVVMGICNLTMKRRLPPVNVRGGLLNLAAFKQAPFTIYCLSSFINFLGLYTMLTYVNVSATQLGSSSNIAPYFVAFANASSLFGRWMSGLVADATGAMNIMIPFTFFAGILTYAWPFARSTGDLVAITVIYGFCSGTYVSLLTVPLMNIGGEGDVGRRVGMFLTITALGAVAGPPISGAINAGTGGFEAVGLYAGSTVMVGIGCMIVVRYLVLGQWSGKL